MLLFLVTLLFHWYLLFSCSFGGFFLLGTHFLLHLSSPSALCFPSYLVLYLRGLTNNQDSMFCVLPLLVPLLILPKRWTSLIFFLTFLHFQPTSFVMDFLCIVEKTRVIKHQSASRITNRKPINFIESLVYLFF